MAQGVQQWVGIAGRAGEVLKPELLNSAYSARVRSAGIGQRDVKYVVYSGSVTTSSTRGLLLIDKSGTTVWPHATASTIVVDSLGVTLQTSSTFDGYATVAFLSGVNTTNSDLNIIGKYDLGVSSAQTFWEDFGDAGFRTDTGDVLVTQDANNTNYKSGAAGDLPGPTGTTAQLANGDIILDIPLTTGRVDFAVRVGYHTET